MGSETVAIHAASGRAAREVYAERPGNWRRATTCGITVHHLTDSVSPIAYPLDKVGLAIAILAVSSVTFGATTETLMGTAYITAQFFGWS